MSEFEYALGRYLDESQLNKIRSIKVGIAGAGGLGSNCANALVRTGFRNIKIVDFDIVDYSNLNRQFYFFDQVGRSKVDCIKENLIKINPYANIHAINAKLDFENISEVFADCDVVVEAFDEPEFKKMIVEAYISSDKLLVAASGLAGWGSSDSIKVHKIKDNFYLIGDLSTGIGPGVPPLAPRVFIAAAKEADVVLCYALGNVNMGCEL